MLPLRYTDLIPLQSGREGPADIRQGKAAAEGMKEHEVGVKKPYRHHEIDSAVAALDCPSVSTGSHP